MNDDGDDWMAWFIKEYDNMEDPDLRAELLMCHGIHPSVLASERRRLARRKKFSPAEQATTPSVPRTSRATRRPTTPRRSGGPRTYQVTRTRRIRKAGRTVTSVTTTVTVTTVTTVTTISS
ncbi:hypothetical protein OIE71_11600 [Streptomyces sp. NBC_01725]|uniref:hypothetical protein n=1 Tax=Streptomyces sp. NBC_01725 TaxID=2975923 RepID=UPI002E27C5E7|nr:hypothetical protein [Streptomyces sp. NBC_01725]